MTLDSRLKWKNYIKVLKTKIKIALNLMKVVSTKYHAKRKESEYMQEHLESLYVEANNAKYQLTQVKADKAVKETVIMVPGYHTDYNFSI